jgi:hypothetical protein
MTSELDRIERRAQEVRGQLALDLDELFVRLQPRRVIGNAGAYARATVVAYGRDAQTGSGLGRDIVRDMRRNPIPYLLVGIGLAGLSWAISSFSRARTRARLPEFTEADFVPPPLPRVAATHPVAPAAPTVTAPTVAPAAATPSAIHPASTTPLGAARPVSTAAPAGTREISPVTPAAR